MADIKKVATRESYGKALAELGKEYDIVVLDADLSKSTKTETFKKEFPERFINMGIAEQNMMSTAAGLASCGKVVFASSFPPTNATLSSRFNVKEMLSRTFTPSIVLLIPSTVNTSLPISRFGRKSIYGYLRLDG